MGSTNVSFEAAVVAAVGVTLGIAHLVGAMLAMLSDGGTSVLLLGESIPGTTVVGTLLLLVAGFLGTGHRYGRYLGVVAFGGAAVLGRPSLAAPEAFPVAQSGLALAVALYLTVRDPVPVAERSNVDESTSASKVGSTIR